MLHKNYFEIKANSYYEMGIKEGILFGKHLRKAIKKFKNNSHWKFLESKSKLYLDYTKKIFPQYIDELQGYSKGAKIKFQDTWLYTLNAELPKIDKCTSIISNTGKMIAHNEDWDIGAKDLICILKKSIGKLSVFELFYYNTLGGNTISINSHGIIQTINTLTHKDKCVGIPKNIISRWFSETKNPEIDLIKFSKLKRASGYNHNFVNKLGEIWNLESSAKKYNFEKINPPFVHTNHYLSKLKNLENRENMQQSIRRYKFAKNNIKNRMTFDKLKMIMEDKSQGINNSICNKNTIASMIIDIERKYAYIWLLQEPNKGWIKYDLNNLL